MSECVLDGEPTTVDSTFESWGELLQAVDCLVSAAGRVVTAVRFEGVGQPSFREAGATPLASLRRIDVDSIDVSTLLWNSVTAVEDGLTALAFGSRRVAAAFRGPDIADANRQLVDFLDAAGRLTTLTGAIGEAGGIDLSFGKCGSNAAARALDRVASRLVTLACRQRAGNWPAVADGLDDLAPALVGWRDVLDAIGTRCCA
jgi:hypothetical protein